MINNKYNLHDEVSVKGCTKDFTVTEISIATKGIEYKLWEEGTSSYAWYENFQIQDRKHPIGFRVR